MTDAEALAIVRAARPEMQKSVEHGFHRDPRIYDRAGRPCRRCGEIVLRPRPGRRQPHDLLVPGMPGLIRVGHKGADHVAPGNTIASFEAALEHGVDMIEFDVLPRRDGSLVLAHDPEDARSRTPLTLAEGLDHFAGEAYGGVELDVDLKVPGYEREVIDGLRERGLDDRALISSTYPESLALVRELHPDIRRGWSVPRARRDYTESKLWLLPALAVLTWWRSGLPREGRARAAARRVRGADGPSAAGEPPAGGEGARGGRADLRVDGRRRGRDRPPRGARRRRRDHERPAAVRLGAGTAGFSTQNVSE